MTTRFDFIGLPYVYHFQSKARKTALYDKVKPAS